MEALICLCVGHVIVLYCSVDQCTVIYISAPISLFFSLVEVSRNETDIITISDGNMITVYEPKYDEQHSFK